VSAPILTLTPNPALDLSTEIDEVVPHVKLRCEPPALEPGGGGLNVARALHALGAEPLAVYTSGAPVGAWIGDLLDKEGLLRRAVAVAGPTRESIAVLDRSRRDQFRFVLPGPELAEREWRDLLGAVEELLPTAAGYVVASGSLSPGAPVDFYARVSRLAREHGRKLVLDASGEALAAALEEGVHLINPNFREFDAVAGCEEDDDARERAAEQLVREGGAEAVVITLGHRGSLAVTASSSLRLGPGQVEAVSGVGAGDSYTAGLTLGLVWGWSLERACAYGAAAAAATWLTPGTGLHRPEAVDRLATEVTVERGSTAAP
jgi:6-phosphofructokinase 2